MILKSAATVALSLALTGCGATLPGMSTGSIFGGEKAAAPAPVPQNDLVARALQVGGTAARAQKCGYNFDPEKLKANFIAAESAANPADAARAAQLYDASYRGVVRAVADRGEDYCSGAKTAAIKANLARHMAGDFSTDATGFAANAE